MIPYHYFENKIKFISHYEIYNDFILYQVLTSLSEIVSYINVDSGSGQVRGQVRDDSDVLNLGILGDSVE